MKIDFPSILSDIEFDCFNFHDGKSLNQQDKTNVAQCLRNILCLLLEDMGYQHHYRPVDMMLRHDLHDWSDKKLVPLFPDKGRMLQAIMDCSAQCAEYFYHLCQHETKLVMAIVATVFVASDDNAILNPDERKSLSYFSFNHWQSLPEENRWCTVLTKALKMCAEYFGSQYPTVGSLAANSYSAFVDACAQETRLENGLPVHIGNHEQSHSCSEECSVESFPAYFRSSNAAPLLYLIPIFKVSRHEEVPLRFWITVIPGICKYINYMNDLLSCPKEVLAEETWNYLFMRTQAKRQAGRLTRFRSKQNKLWSFRDTLCETIEEVQRTTLALEQAFTECIPTEIRGGPVSMNATSGSAQDEKNHINISSQLLSSGLVTSMATLPGI